MKKTTVLLSLILCLFMVTGVLNANDVLSGFKNVKWNMSKTEVILLEPDLPLGETDEELYYRPDFFSDTFLLKLQDENLSVFEERKYCFDSGDLERIERLFHPVIMNNPRFDYAALFLYFADMLDAQYGSGVYEEMWKTEHMEGNINHLVYAGELVRTK